MRKNKSIFNYQKMRILGYTCVGLTGLTTCVALFPSTFSSAEALENTATYAESRVSVKATASLSISVDSQVNIELTPNSNGAFGYKTAKLNVSTNNEEGYQLFLSTINGEGSLKNTDTNKTGANHEITSITQDTVGINFTGNTWGYSLSRSNINENSTYKSIPTSTTSIYSTSSAPVGTSDTYNLGFGTHISTSLASGEYSNSVVVSAIANPTIITNLSQLVYMQDMNPDICANTAYADGSTANAQYKLNPVTKQLYDIRDGKQYWVAKLADGNCWMTQDLKLDLSTTKTLTPSDTDISANWTPVVNTNTTDTIRTPGTTNVYQSWNIGQIVLATPSKGYNCPTASSGAELLSQCGTYFKNVDGWTTGFSANNSTSIDESAKKYDAHYLVGNYYQWDAATAGTGPLTDSINHTPSEVGTDGSKLVNASGSICPAGWKIPTAGRQTNADTGLLYDLDDSFYRLAFAYGAPENTKISNTTNQGYWLNGNRGVPVTSMSSPAVNLNLQPAYFVRGGLIDGKLMSANSIGYYYSSTAYPIETGTVNRFAFGLGISSGDIYPGDNAFRYYGWRVRCLAK